MPQFNGKQGATRDTREANLRCPRNGKRSDVTAGVKACNIIRASSNPSHWARYDTSAPGKADESDPPARIPANTEAEPRASEAPP
jgi:hypothetical protein